VKFYTRFVGQQSAGGANTPLFTMGNFAITTNMDPKTSKKTLYLMVSQTFYVAKRFKPYLRKNTRVIG
jgi:hypothetical protein